jgi:hypothetical protein
MPKPNYKRFPKTGITIDMHDGGRVTFDYGHSMGSTTFDTVACMADPDNVPRWITERRKRLVAEAAELDKVERVVERMATEALEERLS